MRTLPLLIGLLLLPARPPTLRGVGRGERERSESALPLRKPPPLLIPRMLRVGIALPGEPFGARSERVDVRCGEEPLL